jgi:hypothetical protein
MMIMVPYSTYPYATVYRNKTPKKEWDLAEQSERSACVPKVASSSFSGGSESTFRSDLTLKRGC